MNNNSYSSNHHMGNYRRVFNNGSGFRGFRLNLRKLSIQRLRVKFLSLIRRWRKTYERAIRSLRQLRRSSSRSKRMINKKSSSRINNSYSYLIGGGERKSSMENQYGTVSFRSSLSRSNSFYSEAIADCLEFIKRNSLSLDDDPHHHHHDEAAPIVASIR